MNPVFLIPKSSITSNGSSVAIPVDASLAIQLTLVITKIIEQESIDIHLQGSADGEIWLEKPLTAFPQKFYTGSSVLVCEFKSHPDIRFFRATWKVNRWGRGSLKPNFELYLFADPIASVALDSK